MTKKSLVLAALAAGLVFSGSAFAANNIAVQAACALNGTNFGLCVNMQTGQTNFTYVQDNSPNAETTFRANFWIDPNSVAMAANIDFVVFACSGPLTAAPSALRLFLVRDSTGTNYRLRGYSRNNPGEAVNWSRTNALTIGDAARNVEVQWKADTSPGGTDGFVKVTRLDNAASVTATDTINDQHVLNRCFFGAVTSIEGTANGQVRLDQYASFR